MSLNHSDWNVLQTLALLDYPEQSLGFQLGSYLLRNNLDFERNDVFRILTKYNGSFTNETCLQYYLLGNGKRGFATIAYLVAGTLLEPYKINVFLAAFNKGKKAHRFYDLEFSKLLSQPVDLLQSSLNIR